MISKIRLFVTSCFGLLVVTSCSDNTSVPSALEPNRPHVQTHVGSVAALSADEAKICELLLRDWLHWIQPDEPGFVAVGMSTDERWLDPPPAFMQRIVDVGVKLRKASEARIPKPGERVAPDRFRGVEDPDTGKSAYIHYVVITRWISNREAEVEAGMYSGPLSGGGFSAVVEKKNGRWQFKGEKQNFVS